MAARGYEFYLRVLKVLYTPVVYSVYPHMPMYAPVYPRIYRGYYMAARGYEFYLRVLKVSLTSERSERVRDTLKPSRNFGSTVRPNCSH